MNWFFPMFVFASLSVRTPNVLPNPYDYEISIGMEKKDQLYLNRQWERELGREFIDEEYWAQYQYGSLVTREKYVNKTSRGITYNQVEIRYARKGYYSGLAIRSVADGHSLRSVFGWEVDRRINVLVANAQLVIKTELSTDGMDMDYVVYAKPKLGIMKNLDLYALLKAEKAGNRSYLQGKIGFEIELPGIGS